MTDVERLEKWLEELRSLAGWREVAEHLMKKGIVMPPESEVEKPELTTTQMVRALIDAGYFVKEWGYNYLALHTPDKKFNPLASVEDEYQKAFPPKRKNRLTKKVWYCPKHDQVNDVSPFCCHTAYLVGREVTFEWEE